MTDGVGGYDIWLGGWEEVSCDPWRLWGDLLFGLEPAPY